MSDTSFWGYNRDNHHLVRFNGANPSTFTTDLPLTGLTANEFVAGLDYRPAAGTLYAVVANTATTTMRIAAINVTTGAVSALGGTSPLTGDTSFGVDFDPVLDRLRVIGDGNTNQRFDPNDGSHAGMDLDVYYVAGDSAEGEDPNVVHIAYTNSQAGAAMTTLFGIDSARDTLVRIGGANGNPSATTGGMTTIGSLGVDVDGVGGFDIQPFSNSGFASLRVGGVQRLYRIDLTTGAATQLGTLGNGTNMIGGLSASACPTAAGVEVSGRVTTSDGRGLRNATVSMVDANGVTRTATTSTFGYFAFEDVNAGESYVISVSSRRYRFTPRIVQVLDTLAGVDFTGQE